MWPTAAPATPLKFKVNALTAIVAAVPVPDARIAARPSAVKLTIMSLWPVCTWSANGSCHSDLAGLAMSVNSRSTRSPRCSDRITFSRIEAPSSSGEAPLYKSA